MQWWLDRIAPVSAQELGFFRTLFGTAVAWVVYELRLPAQPFPPDLHLHTHLLADWNWVHALAARPDRVASLEWLIIATALVFAVGLFTRVAFSACVIAITIWTLVRLTHTSAHNWSALFITLWALLPVRWGDGLSVDALIGWLRGRPSPSAVRRTDYGYALWVPGLVFGAAMAGAGVAKLAQSGLGWITNGSVKYHFLIDSANAPTDWGLWVASHPTIAVWLSAAAIVTECTIVLAVLVPRWTWRLPFALMAFGLLVGFYVFQNEMWLAWWLLCLAFFIPWPSIVRAVSRRATAVEVVRSVTPTQVFAIVAVCALQIVASVLRIEHAPIMSDYPMYATTYTSIADFEQRNAVPPIYHFSVRFDDGVQMHASELFDDLGIDGPVRDAYRAIIERRETAADAPAVVAEAERRLVEHFGRPITAIIVSIDQRAFDWEKGRFYWKTIRKPVYTFEIKGVGSI